LIGKTRLECLDRLECLIRLVCLDKLKWTDRSVLTDWNVWIIDWCVLTDWSVRTDWSIRTDWSVCVRLHRSVQKDWKTKQSRFKDIETTPRVWKVVVVVGGWYLDYRVNSGPFSRFSMRFEFLSENSDHSVCETRDPSLTILNSSNKHL